MREIDGALRGVLSPLAKPAGTFVEAAKPGNGDSHKTDVRSVLAFLGVSEEDQVAKRWLSHAGTYHKMAHRSALGEARPLKPVMLDLFEEFDGILDYVLSRMEAKYSSVLRRVDSLAARRSPTNKDVTELLDSVPRDVVAFGRFCDRAADPAWLALLRRKALFKSPPAPEVNPDDSTVTFPPWPPMQLLVRFAPKRPDEVVEITRQIPPTDNAAVNSKIADVAKNLPDSHAAALVSRLMVTLEAKYDMVTTFKLGEQVGRLTAAGFTKEALSLAASLLAFKEPGAAPEGEPKGAFVGAFREPQTRIDQHAYRDILRRYAPGLIVAAGSPGVVMLADLLDRAITMSSSEEMIATRFDNSSIWLPEIDAGSIAHHFGIRTALVSGLRDGTAARVRSHPTELQSLVEHFEARQWPIFRRLALHLIKVHGQSWPDLVSRRLLDRDLFHDYQVSSEYQALLAARFELLSVGDRRSVLSMIEAELDLARYRQMFQRIHHVEPSEEECRTYVEKDILQRLSVVATYLPEEWLTRYQELLSKHGDPSIRPAEPAGIVFSTDGLMAADELAGLDVDTLIDHLRSCQPRGFTLDPGKHRLASMLTELVVVEPDRYLPFADGFASLDSDYVAAMLHGLRRAVRSGASVDWNSVIKYCALIVARPDQTASDEEFRRWGWVHLDVIGILGDGLRYAHQMPQELGDTAFGLVKRLSTNLYSRQEEASDELPAIRVPDDLSSTVRSSAVQFAIEYGSRRSQRDPGSSFVDITSFVDSCLDVTDESSVGVRAVIGRNFSWLGSFDQAWVAEAASRVFPDDPALRSLWESAWDGYLEAGMPNKRTWLVLKTSYELAVERIGYDPENSSQRKRDQLLVNHLASLYWWGEVHLHEGPLARLISLADEELRTHLLVIIGRGLTEADQPLASTVIDRLLALWNARVDAVRSSPSAELSAFGWWFVAEQLPADKRLEGLRQALEVSGSCEPADQVIERLASMSNAHPREAAELLLLMTQAESEGWRFALWDDAVDTIVTSARLSDDVDATRFSREAANRAAAKGHDRWLSLVDGP